MKPLLKTASPTDVSSVKSAFSLISRKVTSIALIALPFVYIADLSLKMPILHDAISWYILALILLILPQVRGFIFYMSSVLFLFGVSLYAVQGSAQSNWSEGMLLNLSLVALFLSVPLLGIPVRVGGYFEALAVIYARYLKHVSYYYIVTQSLTHLMAIFLNIGAVPIFHYLSSAHPYVKSKRILGTALMRAFAASICWSPFFSSMALIVGQLKIPGWMRLGFCWPLP